MVGFSPLCFPHQLVSPGDYEAAASSAEIKVVVGPALHSQIKAALHFDRRPDGARGRALKTDIVAAGLCKGDRLEPSRELPDVFRFEELPLPCLVTFWRRRNTARLTHRSPLLDPSLGITISNLVIEQLHTFNLGVMLQYCRELVWELILSDAWHVKDGRTEAELLEVSVAR